MEEHRWLNGFVNPVFITHRLPQMESRAVFVTQKTRCLIAIAERTVTPMAELKPCPFDNHNCMCQFCEEPCNNGLNCSDCNHEGKAVHEVYLCTGFEGDLTAYISHWRTGENRRVGDTDG